MAKKLGNNYRLWIYDGVSAYHEIAGNTSLKLTRNASSIDTSTKDDYPYGTQAPGLKTLTIDAEFYPNLPDTNGFAKLETAAAGTTALSFQIRKGGSSGADPADVVFQATMYVGNFDTDFGKNDVVKATCQLTLDSAPTVDTLA